MENSGFFNGDEEYGQDEFNRYFRNLFQNGVSLDDGGALTLKVTAGENGVTLSKGFAIVEGFFYYNDADKAVALQRDPYLPRVDRVVLRLDLAAHTVRCKILEGTASSTPAAPVLTRDELVYEISLASVYIPAEGDMVVTDERADTKLCGAIRPKNLTEYQDMVTEFQRRYEAWFAMQQSVGWRKTYIQSLEPEEHVEGSIWLRIR
jgi:hypothetical protein